MRARAQQRLSHVAQHIDTTLGVPVPAFPAPPGFLVGIIDAIVSTGAIGISDMTAIVAPAKTMVLLAEQGWDGNNWEADTVHALIVQSLAGECAVTDRIGVLGRNRLLPGGITHNTGRFGNTH